MVGAHQPHVAIGDDADERVRLAAGAGLQDREVPDVALLHQGLDVADRRVGADGDDLAGHDVGYQHSSPRVGATFAYGS